VNLLHKQYLRYRSPHLSSLWIPLACSEATIYSN